MVLCGAACGCVYHHHPEQGCYQRTCHQDWGSSRMKMISKYSNIINQRIILPPPSLVSSVCLLISTNFRVLLEGFCWMRIYEFHQIPSQGLPSDVPRLQWVNYANLKRFLHWRGETRNLAFISDSCHGGLLIVDLWEGDCHKKELLYNSRTNSDYPGPAWQKLENGKLMQRQSFIQLRFS